MSNRKPAVTTLSMDECVAELREAGEQYPGSRVYEATRESTSDLNTFLKTLLNALIRDLSGNAIPSAVWKRVSALSGRILALAKYDPRLLSGKPVGIRRSSIA